MTGQPDPLGLSYTVRLSPVNSRVNLFEKFFTKSQGRTEPNGAPQLRSSNPCRAGFVTQRAVCPVPDSAREYFVDMRVVICYFCRSEMLRLARAKRASAETCHAVTLALEVRLMPIGGVFPSTMGGQPPFVYDTFGAPGTDASRRRVAFRWWKPPFPYSPGRMEFSGSAHSGMNPSFLVRPEAGAQSAPSGGDGVAPNDCRYAQGLQ
jgi:hypothetical protein